MVFYICHIYLGHSSVFISLQLLCQQNCSKWAVSAKTWRVVTGRERCWPERQVLNIFVIDITLGVNKRMSSVCTSNPPLYASDHLIFSVTMDAIINVRALTDIAETVQKNTDIVPQQLAACGITISHIRAYILLRKMSKLNEAHD